MGTNRWLRMCVYERVTNYSTILTYSLSAIWHGFYPGYYITFASGALFTFAARNMRRAVRHHFTHNSTIKFAYDAVTSITTRFVMSYLTFSFVLLEFWPSIRLFLHMYLCLHILGLIALLIVPLLVPKQATKKESNGSVLNKNHNTTNGSVTHALNLDIPKVRNATNHID